MQCIHVEISSAQALIYDRIVHDGESLSPAKAGNTRRKELDLPREQARPKVYLSKDETHLILPADMLWACIVNAGKFQKMGRSKLTTRDSSLLPGIVELNVEEIPLLDPETDEPLGAESFEVDTRPVRNLNTGGVLITHRPRIDAWKARFDLWYDPEELSEGVVRQLIDDAGRRIGLGVMRPEKKKLYGRFKVTHWQLEREKNGRASKAEAKKLVST